MIKGIVKIIGYVIIIGLIVSSAFYFGLVAGLGNLISTINSDFIAFIPTEIRVLLVLLLFGIIVGTAFTFIN